MGLTHGIESCRVMQEHTTHVSNHHSRAYSHKRLLLQKLVYRYKHAKHYSEKDVQSEAVGLSSKIRRSHTSSWRAMNPSLNPFLYSCIPQVAAEKSFSFHGSSVTQQLIQAVNQKLATIQYARNANRLSFHPDAKTAGHYTCIMNHDCQKYNEEDAVVAILDVMEILGWDFRFQYDVCCPRQRPSIPLAVCHLHHARFTAAAALLVSIYLRASHRPQRFLGLPLHLVNYSFFTRETNTIICDRNVWYWMISVFR